MYFSAADRGEMMSMVYNWPADQVYFIFLLRCEFFMLELVNQFV